MKYDQVFCVCGRILLIWQVSEGLSEKVTSEPTPDIKKSQCKVSGKRPTQTKEVKQRSMGKSEWERAHHAQETDERFI